MNKLKKFSLLCFAPFLLNAQNSEVNSELTGNSNPTVFVVNDNQEVQLDEFERQFLKNLNLKEKAVTAADIDEYLKLYIRFKLKIQDAKDAGKDTLENYKRELAMYRDQLSRNYLYDREVTDNLIKEAYERSLYEVRVQHILIRVDRNASNAAVERAKKRLLEIRNQLLRDPSAENFATLASSDSQDDGTKENGGDLGYLTALQVVYEFENAAYNTQVGEISDIFRTDFGFHILRVQDKRKNRGDIRVRHIMLRTGKNSNTTDEEAEKKITEIHSKIASGKESFEDMARNYSEDFSSKYNGGLVNWVNPTQFVGDLERQDWIENAYRLKEDGQMTEPFRTSYGWHILMREGIRAVGSFEDAKNSIKTKVQQNPRSQISLESFVSRLKVEENYTENKEIIERFFEYLKTDSGFLKGNFDMDNMPETVSVNQNGKAVSYRYLDAELFRFAGEPYSVEEFAMRLGSNKSPIKKDISDWILNEYNDWVRDVAIAYQNEHLEEKSSEFKFIFQEYREGILMFNRMQEMVWDKANNDSIGLATYFQANINDYQWDDRFNAEFYFCVDNKMMKKVFKQVKKGIAADSLRREHTRKNQLDFNYKIGKYQLTDTFLFPNNEVLKMVFSNEKFKSKEDKVYKMGQVGNDFVVLKVKSFLPAGPKSLDETRGPVASKYQTVLEKEWIADLEKRYPVTINYEVVEEFKRKLNAK